MSQQRYQKAQRMKLIRFDQIADFNTRSSRNKRRLAAKAAKKKAR